MYDNIIWIKFKIIILNIYKQAEYFFIFRTQAIILRNSKIKKILLRTLKII